MFPEQFERRVQETVLHFVDPRTVGPRLCLNGREDVPQRHVGVSASSPTRTCQ